MRPTRWLRAPLLHFVVGGASLFGVVHATSRSGHVVGPIAVERVFVGAADVTRLRADYTRETGLEPTSADEAALIDKAVDEELLFREALARGLDRYDRSVRNWLVEQMRVLAEDGRGDPDGLYAQARALGLDRTDAVVRRILVQKMRLLAARSDERPPSADELAEFYARHRDEYRTADRTTFWHVFVSSDRRGAAMDGDARALLETLRRAGRPPVAPMAAGDAFAVPAHVVGQAPSQLAKVFGGSFAATIGRTAPGAWVGPIVSPYGVHLVWVDRHDAGEPPPLAAVRGRVLERWQDAERARRVAAMLSDLRRRHPLEIQSSAWLERSRS